MGPFPVTQRQKQYLLVVVDYFTRWVELFPLRTTTSSDIAHILVDEIICRWGCPTYILSDNGPQFVSELFTNICSSLGIRNKTTSNYHPQTNMTERMNRNLKPMIAQYAQENAHSWDRHLSKLALSIRTSVNETTGDTPAYLNFGRDPKLPLDLLITNPGTYEPLLPTSISTEVDTYKQYLRKDLLTAHRIAQEHNEVRKMQQKNKYDQHSSKRSFKEGQLVWVSIPSVLKHGNLILYTKDLAVLFKSLVLPLLSSTVFPMEQRGTLPRDTNGPHLVTPLQPLMSVNVSIVNNTIASHISLNNNLPPPPSLIHSQRYQRPVRTRKQPNRLNL
ncbi:unnamed protein product [Rotaria magnacalcarata]|uniref:Integrase catalytic domain-containing protein n=2 Tax=Rotaria magnacalcarata TaxID=392030 RepID=A0A820ISZ3_9BILA|nr:unnamed protein product [Rotaria magnacalcarata]